MNLNDYVFRHTERNACQCGRCVISGENKPLSIHTSNVYFFEVCKNGQPTKEKFIELIKAHKGEFNECNPLDGQEHGYIELGGWLGSQDNALRFIALGELLNVWHVMHPGKLPGLPPELAGQMAGMGLISICGLVP